MEEITSAVISELTSCSHQEVPDENMNSPFSYVSSSIKWDEVDFQQPSPVSILEPLFESRSPDGISPNDESKEGSSSSPGDHEMFKWLSKRWFLAPDDETEFSYSSCSSFRMEFDSKPAVSYSMSSNGSRNWELAYIKDIMDNDGLILADVLPIPRKEPECPSQFEEMEDLMNRMCEYEDKPKDRRKLLFDCAAECVESRCRHARIFEMKKWFVDEFYEEITSQKGIGDMLVDMLVDADMSSRQGKWIEFNAEMYEEGVKIGKGILVFFITKPPASAGVTMSNLAIDLLPSFTL